MVFGEDENDRSALAELVRALVPSAPPARTIRKPLVLMKDRAEAERRKNASSIARQVAAQSAAFEVRLVVAHQDCDDYEPAHVALAETIESQLDGTGVPVVAATPAWETEAWWYQWPEAVLQVNRRWRDPNRRGTRIGKLQDAKETLRRDLRPKSGTTRDYRESDGPAIARHVRELGIVDERRVQSASFDRLADRVRAILTR